MSLERSFNKPQFQGKHFQPSYDKYRIYYWTPATWLHNSLSLISHSQASAAHFVAGGTVFTIHAMLVYPDNIFKFHVLDNLYIYINNAYVLLHTSKDLSIACVLNIRILRSNPSIHK